jgi:hypothetical protein
MNKPNVYVRWMLTVEERLRGESWRALSFHETPGEAMHQLKKSFPDAKDMRSATDHESEEIAGTLTAWRTLHFTIKKANILI